MLTNKVRIIGGSWRGRKLSFPNVSGLRPTADRIRETLFNWLMPAIHGARCLDLFAGSGALGFEAASRGAEHVVMVDQEPAVIKQLQTNKALLKTDSITVCQAAIPSAITLPIKPFDIVFLDPPFKQGLINQACQWLDQQQLLAPQAWIYLETEAELEPLPIPAHWEILRAKQAGQVKYYLVRSNIPG